MQDLAKQKKKAAPIEVKAGSVTVKIYTVKNRGSALYTVTYRGAMGLQRRQFADLAEAKLEANLIATKIQNGQGDVLQLSSEDRGVYLQALEFIRPTGERLNAAAEKYAEAFRIIGAAGSVVEAARFFAKHHPAALPKKSVPDVYDEFRMAKEAEGVSSRYLQDIRSRLGRFAKQFLGRISELTTGEIDTWLASMNVGAVARNSTRAMIITFFNFARQRGYLPKNQPTEAEAVALAKERPSEIGIFTPEQMSDLLTKAEEKLVPYIAIGGFAGLRHAELMRLEWSDVKLSQGFIVVSAKAAKTAQRRTVPIQPNLQKWLEPFADHSGTLFHGYGSRFLNKVTSVARALEFEWPHNGLRHSFASYRLATCKSAAEVSLEMGNSPQMVFRHYRELVSPQDAANWWLIKPKGT